MIRTIISLISLLLILSDSSRLYDICNDKCCSCRDGRDGRDGRDAQPCNLITFNNSCNLLQCPSSEAVLICDGEDGSSCSITDTDNGAIITCDNTEAFISDGRDAQPCTITTFNDTCQLLECSNNSTLICNGIPGSSCTINQISNNTSIIECDDGTNSTIIAPECECNTTEIINDVLDNVSSCTVTQLDNGAFISCTDGSNATINNGGCIVGNNNTCTYIECILNNNTTTECINCNDGNCTTENIYRVNFELETTGGNELEISTFECPNNDIIISAQITSPISYCIIRSNVAECLYRDNGDTYPVSLSCIPFNEMRNNCDPSECQVDSFYTVEITVNNIRSDPTIAIECNGNDHAINIGGILSQNNIEDYNTDVRCFLDINNDNTGLCDIIIDQTLGILQMSLVCKSTLNYADSCYCNNNCRFGECNDMLIDKNFIYTGPLFDSTDIDVSCSNANDLLFSYNIGCNIFEETGGYPFASCIYISNSSIRCNLIKNNAIFQCFISYTCIGNNGTYATSCTCEN